MPNYKLTIQYNGTRYHGWQIQNNALTIQQCVSDAIKTILKENVNLIGAGRTDAGVHALGQNANFRCGKELEVSRFTHSLNGILPPEIAITDCSLVHDSFHARFDALSRSYKYMIYTRKNPFLKNRAFFIPRVPDIALLNSYCQQLIGRRDFEPFCKQAPDNGNTMCTVLNCRWYSHSGLIQFYIEADRFLHGMVRLLVGSMLHAEKNCRNDEWITLAFSNKTKTTFAVPPVGLYLFKVTYPSPVEQRLSAK